MRIFLIFLAALLFASCFDNGSDSTGDNMFIPLKAGNTWDYKTTYKSDNIPDQTYTEKITGTTTVDGKTAYFYDDEGQNAWIEYSDRYDRVEILAGQVIDRVLATIPKKIKAGMKQGDYTWIRKESVTTAAGTFDCWVRETETDFDMAYMFVSSGTGIVQYTRENKNTGEVSSRTTLTGHIVME